LGQHSGQQEPTSGPLALGDRSVGQGRFSRPAAKWGL
jgi:hypothetical protein